MLRHAYGPGSITCVAIVPGKAHVLEEVTDFSISTHFDKIPVRRLGHRYPVGWATGAGSVAGTLVCAQLTEGALWKLRKHAGAVQLYAGKSLIRNQDLAEGLVVSRQVDHYASAILPQQLPPFHLMFVHTNESGQMSIARLYNVVISDQGETKGAHNAFSEESLQYQASHYEQMRLHKSLELDELSRLANRQVGFFSDIYRTETLGESLANVVTDGNFGSDELPRYLLEESEEYQRRIEQGLPTSASIADTGDVIFVDLPSNTNSSEVSEPIEVVRSKDNEQGGLPVWNGVVGETLITSNGVVNSELNASLKGRELKIYSPFLDPNPHSSTGGAYYWDTTFIQAPNGSLFSTVNPLGYYNIFINSATTNNSALYKPDGVELWTPGVTGEPNHDSLTITRKARFHDPIYLIRQTVEENDDSTYFGRWRGHTSNITFINADNEFTGTLIDTEIPAGIQDGDSWELLEGSGITAKLDVLNSGATLQITLTIADKEIVIE